MNRKALTLGLTAATCLALVGCDSSSNDTAIALPTPTPTLSPSPTPLPNIVAVAAANPNFSTLVTALQAAGLVGALQQEGPFTVFAPTNAAFAALLPGTVEALLRPENRAELVRILTYHVVPGLAPSSALRSGQQVTTLQGSPVTVTLLEGGRIRINNANVITADIQAANGIIHVIDTVLIPPR
ncbi:fasciclin domain-containing protein [Synechococcus sp. R60.4]|uniref:fasciclin domain-containing protein n=1 Tax=unclassified Synechococcus TaxID=2626047 RepID=UPI0039C2737C